jgi:glycosyltransferase involved in cell wall biosynthesis
MTVNEKLAVLIPVYNGGDGLARSIQSCVQAQLPSDSYELIVVDNCSTDGAVALLPHCDAGGAPIHVHSNPNNIGRVPNWNRAVDIALERGFQYITFLFAGDCWLPGRALPDLFDLLRESNAAIAFAPFVVAASDGQVKCVSQRFHVVGPSAVLHPRAFLTTLLNSGLFPLGPLQANLYRIDPRRRPLFDPAQPTRTDVEATLAFIESATSPVVVGSEPFLEWREHAGRFHMSMGPARTIQDYMETFQRACLRTALPVNYGRAKARVVLNSLRLMMSDAPVRQWPRLLSLVARCALRTPHRIRLFHFIETLWERFALGRRLLQFG